LNYKQQLNIIEGLFIPPETLIRVDCPFCKNINTLSVDTTENNIKWYCFHASCKAKGKKEREKNMQYVSATFNKKENNINERFIIPDSFKIVSTNKNAQMYLHKNNCWEAWAWGRADIKYDVKQDRVVFLIKNRNTDEIVGAVGRGLNKNVYPKWFMYDNKDVPFKCGECEDAVIVEDCPSACAVSNILTGIAIMGTKLKEEHKKHLKPYKKLYICLDRDATTKAYDIAKDLRSSGFDNVVVKPLEDDLKYFNTDQIKEMFYE
jgi:DNA primase